MPSKPFAIQAGSSSARSGFTLVELLVVIGIIALLAGVALGPITQVIKHAKESTSVQVAHQMGVLEYSYSLDHSLIYPYATTSEAMANLLLNTGYLNDPNAFYVPGTPGAVKYSGGTAPYALTKNNVNWDYVVNGAAATGLSDTTSDLTPLCQLTGSTHLTPLPTTPGSGLTLTIDPTQTAYGADGIAVVYKGNNSIFVRCVPVNPTTATNTPSSPVPWVSTQYADPQAASYALIQP